MNNRPDALEQAILQLVAEHKEEGLSKYDIVRLMADKILPCVARMQHKRWLVEVPRFMHPNFVITDVGQEALVNVRWDAAVAENANQWRGE